MKQVNTYIILKSVRMHNGMLIKTRYAVGAKDDKQAINLLRDKIGKLCKIAVYYVENKPIMKYKEVGVFEGEFIKNGEHKYRIL